MQRQHLKRLLWVLLALCLPTLLALARIDDSGLKVASAPLGTISFELCNFSSSCDTILREWGEKGQQLEMLSLGLDYLFMVLYSAIICVGLLLTASLVPSSLKSITVALAWIALAAGFADAGENYSLIQVILAGSGQPYGELAGMFSATKFAIIGLTLSWLLFTSIVYALFQRKP